MRTGRRDYDDRGHRGRDTADHYDERRRDARWPEDEGGRDHMRNALRPETDDGYPGDTSRRRLDDDARDERAGADRSGARTPPFPDRSRRIRGERYALSDWSPAERADGYRDDGPDGMGRGRNPGSFGARANAYDDEERGRAAYGRDGYGRDEYGVYGEAMSRGAQGHAGKGPKGWQRSDERIREDVSEALARHSELDPSDIEVEVDGGEVTLSGTVADRRTKRMAEDVAETIFAVRDVHNHLRVQRNADTRTNSEPASPATATSGTIDARQRAKGSGGNVAPSPNAK